MVEMDPSSVTERLRRMAELSRGAEKRPAVDMSPAGIARRLRELSDLANLCFKLMEIGATARLK
jgi:hypothetical protein